MTTKDNDQTLILKDDEEQWLKVLHGEAEPDTNNTAHVSAAAIRRYLIVRDEAIALGSVDIKQLNSISREEARVIYQHAVEEIRRRGKTNWKEFLKTYGVGALFGGLIAAILFLLYLQNSTASLIPPANQSSTQSGLNFTDYPALTFNEKPGEFPNMLLIPGGTTNIGCAKGWDDVAGGCRTTEFPSHPVKLKPFLISQHEVTYGQFRKFVEESNYVTDAQKDNRGCVHEDTSQAGSPFVMNPELYYENPGYDQNDSYPATCVSWHDAQNYIEWLNKETGETYRLPSEAEWEHAARGGKATAYFWGSNPSSNQANYQGTTGKDQWAYASPVGQFPANKYSVQDTSGNLWEWVQDCWHDSYTGAPQDGSTRNGCGDESVRVRRGGAWDMNGAGVRSAIRSKGSIHDRSNLYGFRIAKDWNKPEK